MSFVSHLEGAIDGVRLPADTLQTTHEDRPILVRYDLAAARSAVTKDALADRPHDMWRLRELLPVRPDAEIVSLGETATPLIPCPRLGEALGVPNLLIKDESRLPTGSFKARGMAMAVTMAKALGVRRVAVPTAGNAGGALAAYAARAGLECFVFMPEDTPAVNRAEAALFGARAFLVNGLITDCGAVVRQGAERFGWFDMSTLKEPYRIEGKKTMGLELAEQLGWRLPDAIFYPTGGGTGLIGMWKAFKELAGIGWLDGATGETPVPPSMARGETPIPSVKMFSCQSTGCAPIARAFEAGERFAEPWENAATVASGLRVPRAVGDFLILDAVRESGGAALAAEEARLGEWMRLATATEGVSLCPEAAACVGALRSAVDAGRVGRDETVVIFNTGAVQKYTEAIGAPLPRLDRERVDWSAIEKTIGTGQPAPMQ